MKKLIKIHGKLLNKKYESVENIYLFRDWIQILQKLRLHGVYDKVGLASKNAC